MIKTVEEVKDLISEKLTKYFATQPRRATKDQMYKASALVVRDILLKKKQENNLRIQQGKLKRVYYLCMEFLIGRSLKNNLYNLGLEQQFKEALKSYDFNLDNLYEIESDAGLGNGGLGRLAACFMDSLATLNYPAMGFSIRYEYGLFKQKIVDHMQVELPDKWLDSGEVWMMPRSDKNFQIKLGGHVHEWWDENGKCHVEHKDAEIVEAIPYDLMISGANSDGVGVLRLWQASARDHFDMKSFTQGDYMMAMRADNEAELISKVLYPSDDHLQGKQLRLSQQYFLVSASLQSIFKDHLKNYRSLDNIADKVAVHINDTHPALAVPEMMRLLIDEHGYDWDKAWKMTTGTIAYTNHTVMAEALEKWNEDLVAARLPRIYSIIREINRRFLESVQGTVEGEKIDNMSIIGRNQVRMANLSVIGSHSVNGVSALHSDIIKKSVFRDFYEIYPKRFTNVTNGIAHRRWLNQANPRLAALITELIGDGYLTDASKLEELLKYKDDTSVLKKIGEIKSRNKRDFAKWIKETSGFSLNPETRFDTQIKRLHEYKRQLLNVLKIVGYYIDLTDNPNADFTPQTFIFGAKAAGGYYHAKRIIALINAISDEIGKNPTLKEKLDVMFIENYNVTKAEHLIPASEVSEQISLAGKEASGTSNMKFMLNGAVTLGTVDGANVEIGECVGEDNIFTFGMLTDEVDALWKNGYSSTGYLAHNDKLRRIIDRLKFGFDGESFADIAAYLIMGQNGVADPYMCLADYNDYMRANRELDAAYKDSKKFNSMALVNVAKSGIFAADRSIDEYAKNIWGLRRVKQPN
ncbi:MAG: glycogen/starch/alpha-glucan phosphorylase [Clostridia bacterium]|jgi:starch phosphorylase|nr:glycogen/starch/alpha-glucan phosphorylase [Clostridia bacterium]